jgi:excisionase family DNA binding protein
VSAAWLTTGEAAALLGVSVDTVKRYLAQGRLEGINLPSGHRRITRQSVDTLKAQT